MDNKPEQKPKKKLSKSDRIKLSIMVILIVALVVATILLMPYVLSLRDEAVREALKEYITSKGIWGVLILLGMQILQVVVAVIPGEVIEVLAGLLYGTFGGYFICTIGVLISSIAIYYTVRALGYKSVDKILGEGKLSKFKFLHNQRRLETVVFILFFIPGTPKDLLTYFVPFTNIKPLHFFIISTVARIPSIISSTFAGSSIGDGKWLQTLIIFLVIGVVGIAGIIINDKYTKKIDK